MVAIFTGQGSGMQRGSGTVLGAAGLLGRGTGGRSGHQVMLNAATGNLLIEQNDSMVVGRGPDIALARSYNSKADPDQIAATTPWGFNDRRIDATGAFDGQGAKVRLYDTDGSVITYNWDGSGYTTTAGSGAYDRITKINNKWVHTDGDTQIVEEYGASFAAWNLRTKVTDTVGNTTQYSYVNNGRINRIISSDGSWVQYAYDGPGNTPNVTSVTIGYQDLVSNTQKTERVSYIYDIQNRLTSATIDLSPDDGSTADGRVYTTSYSYVGNSRLCARITETDGSRLDIGYDGNGRVTSLAETVSSTTVRTTTIAYGTGYTTITDAAGQTTRLDYNADGALTSITAPPAGAGASAQVTRFAYTAKGDVASVTDAANKVTSFTFDGNGNVLTETDRLGNVVTRTYDARNQMLTETRTGSTATSTAAALTTRYVYNAAGGLRFTVSADGRVSEQRYRNYGQVAVALRYTDQRYDVAGLSASTALTESQLVNWVFALSDQSAVEQTVFAYDARGNLTNQIDYAESIAPGEKSDAEGYRQLSYVYDQAGRLLNRTQAGQNTEHFVYDGLGRVISSTDLHGGTTSIAFDDAATRTVVTLANGLIRTSTYDKAGALIAYSEAGELMPAASTTYAYDAVGRVRVTTDANGIKSYTLYDKVGRKVADVGETGEISEYHYDATDRVIATVRYANRLSATALATVADPNASPDIVTVRPGVSDADIWAWQGYDAEGRVSMKIDGTGSVVRYSYDAAGRLRSTVEQATRMSPNQISTLRTNPSASFPRVVSMSDQYTSTFYDADGRVIGTLDGAGFLATITYDAAGNRVAETRYATPPTERRSRTLAELIASTTPGAADRTTRYVYDRQGLLRFTIDPSNHVTGHSYSTWTAGSATGQVRSTIDYAGVIAPPARYTLASIRSALAAAGLTTHAANRASYNVFDAAGRLAYAIAADGAVQQYRYDNMGDVIATTRFFTPRPSTQLPMQYEMDEWVVANKDAARDRTTRNFYSDARQLRYTVDAEGYVTRNDYDAAGRLSATLRFPNRVAVTDTTTAATLATLTVNAPVTTTYTYDAMDRLTSRTDPDNAVHFFIYNANGTLQFDVEAIGTADERRTQFGYDGAGRVVTTTDAVGTAEQTVRQTVYNAFGEAVGQVDALGRTTGFTFDTLGRVLTRTDAAGGVTSYAYNAFGDRIQTTDARGNASYSYYDVDGQMVATRDAENYVTEFTYNAFGEIATATRRANRATNAAGASTLPQVAASASDAVTRFGYDKLGRTITTTDAEGFTETTQYNAFGQVTRTRNKLGGGVDYSYDRRGLLYYEYALAITHNGGGTQTSNGYYRHVYTYDSRGNRIRDVEAQGLPEQRTTTYTYDAGDRLIARSGDPLTVGLPGQTQTVTPVESYTYDRRGNIVLTIAADGARTQLYYDDLDRVVAEVRSFGVLIANLGALTTQSYDANGNLVASRRYDAVIAMPAVGGAAPAAPTGNCRETTYAYDNLNRLTTTTVAGVRTGAWNGTQYVTAIGAIATTQQYDANGNVVRSTSGDGGETFSYYDRAGRRIAEVDAEKYLTSWTLDGEGNAVLERRSAARVTSAAIGTPPALPADDAADRVTQFTYDRNGRRRTERRRNVVASSVNSATGALTSATTHATIIYNYNGLGEVTRKTEATGDYVDYTYDNSGRLVREARTPFLDQTGASVRPTVDYRYDGLGDLVQTVENGSRITSHTYSTGGRLLSSTDAGGTTRRYSYDAAGQKIAERYDRYDSAGNLFQEAIVYLYEGMGQLASQRYWRYTAASGWTTVGDLTRMHYNAHGEVVTRLVNDVAQERFSYDNAGRVWRSNAEDGVWRFYVYDGAGNQTLTIEADGADLSTSNVEQALAATRNQSTDPIGTGIARRAVATFNVYDRRGGSIATIMPGRYVGGGQQTTVSTSRTRNAYGEVASDTDALGNTTTYTYNALGRRTVVTHPLVGVTSEAGTTVQANPTERSYYDVSGRLVAVQDANGVTTTRSLQAGTGYGEAEALVLAEWHPDGGVIRNSYDVFGDLRLVTDEVQRQTGMTYDGMGRLIQMTRADGTIDSYGYDALGQRITHADSAYVSTEATDYDVQGRVIATRTFGGDTTTTTYTWDPSITLANLGTRGGYVETTTFANGRSLTEVSDTFAHLVTRTDLGGHVFSYSYDAAGRLLGTATADEFTNYVYSNTGLVTTVSVGRGDASTPTRETLVTTYDYDLRGLKTGEETKRSKVRQEYVNGQLQTVSTFAVLQSASASYDAMGRRTQWSDKIDRDGFQLTPVNFINYLYDAAGNVRRAAITYNNIDQTGAFVAGGNQDQWFRYDAMNRVVTAKGSLVNGAIVRGAAGTDITYDTAGQRAAVTSTVGGTTRRETYSYHPSGQVAAVAFGTLAADGSYQAGGSASYAYDAAGRMTRQIDSDTGGVAYDRTVTYDERGQALTETLFQRQGSDTISATTTTNYGAGANYALGAPVSVTTSGTRNGQATTTSLTTYTYEYFDTALQSTITYKPDVNAATANTTSVSYTGQGVLSSATINDARPRTVTYQANALGQVIRRDESDSNAASGDPHELWFRFDGAELGHLSNNGTLETDYATSVANRTAAAGSGPFRGGAATGTSVADFDGGYRPTNSYDQGSDGGIYTVQTGDTLQSIAQRLYGDASLWYKIAQANGLSTNSQLVEGQILTLPRGVVRTANSATTFRPYDPAAVVGDLLPDETSPTQPQPQARRRRNRCGVFGAILLTVVAVAVTALTLTPAVGLATGLGLGGTGGAIVGGAIAGAAGSVASQAVGVATGIQDRFSFKGVALAALAGGVAGGLGRLPGLGGATGSAGVAQNAARGALGNALTQGVSVVTGLQSRFDFAGVAVGGVVGGVSGSIDQSGIGGRVIAGSASAVAGAATRSLIDGSSFGDNIVSALPDVIGTTVGGALANALRRERGPETAMLSRPAGGGGTLSFLSSAASVASDTPIVMHDIVVVARRFSPLEAFLYDLGVLNTTRAIISAVTNPTPERATVQLNRQPSSAAAVANAQARITDYDRRNPGAELRRLNDAQARQDRIDTADRRVTRQFGSVIVGPPLAGAAAAGVSAGVVVGGIAGSFSAFLSADETVGSVRGTVTGNFRSPIAEGLNYLTGTGGEAIGVGDYVVVGGTLRSRVGAAGAVAWTVAGESEKLSPFTQRYLSESGGRFGSAATRTQNYSLARGLQDEGFGITGGGGIRSEEYIPGAGPGSLGGTFVDVTARSADRTVRIQTVDTLADGVTLTPRENAAAARIRSAFPNDELRLIPKGRQ